MKLPTHALIPVLRACIAVMRENMVMHKYTARIMKKKTTEKMDLEVRHRGSTQKIEHHMPAIFADTENNGAYGHAYSGRISLLFANVTVLGSQRLNLSLSKNLHSPFKIFVLIFS